MKSVRSLFDVKKNESKKFDRNWGGNNSVVWEKNNFNKGADVTSPVPKSAAESVATWKKAVIITIGLLAISAASILIKLCPAPALVIATYRLTFASAFFWIVVFVRKKPIWQDYSRKQLGFASISGLFLTLHFATWVSSLKLTSVASSVVLVQSSPIFVVIGGYFFLKEKINLKMFLGILLTIAGAVVISVHDLAFSQAQFRGNLLAISGAVGAAGYILSGRKLRAQLDTLQYVTVVYSLTALLLLMMTVGAGNSLFDYDLKTFGLFLAIALVPQVIGHTVFNWALKYFSATTVSIIILGEPIGASILAIIFLAEGLDLIKILGGVIIILGVVLVILFEKRS